MQKLRRSGQSAILVIVAALTLAVTLGCNAIGLNFRRPGPTETFTETIELGGADTVEVDLQAGVGDVTLTGGAADLFEGAFSYNFSELRPRIDYAVSGDVGRLDISPVEDSINTIPTGNIESTWDIQLADDVPLAMDVNLGLGDAELDFSDLTLTELEITSGAGDVEVRLGEVDLDEVNHQAGLGEVTVVMNGGRISEFNFRGGAGDVEIDFAGDWSSDMDAEIERGLGEVTLRLPENVGVRVEVAEGLGDVDASGMMQQNGLYVNETYGTSEVTLDIFVSGGAGDVNLILEN